MGLLDSLAAAKDDDFKQATSRSSAGPLQIDLEDIAPDPDQPRKQFDSSLVDTIAKQLIDPDVGQIEAIFVRTNPAGNPPYLIVHGETRYRAAQQASMSKLWAVVTEDSGFIRQLLSNETRGDLTLLEKAAAYQHLIDHHGFTQEAVAVLLGKDAAHVSMHRALLNMPPLVERALNDGKATTVRVLTDLKNLVSAHKSVKALDTIEAFIEKSETITRSQIAELNKRLSAKKPKPKPMSVPMLDGKKFKVLDVELQGSESVISVKRAGEKIVQKYRLVPCE